MYYILLVHEVRIYCSTYVCKSCVLVLALAANFCMSEREFCAPSASVFGRDRATYVLTYVVRRERHHSVAMDPLSLSLSRPPKTRHMYYGETELRTYVRSAARETPLCRRVPLGLSLPRPLKTRHIGRDRATYIRRERRLPTAQPFASLSRLPLKTALRMK